MWDLRCLSSTCSKTETGIRPEHSHAQVVPLSSTGVPGAYPEPGCGWEHEFGWLCQRQAQAGQFENKSRERGGQRAREVHPETCRSICIRTPAIPNRFGPQLVISDQLLASAPSRKSYGEKHHFFREVRRHIALLHPHLRMCRREQFLASLDLLASGVPGVYTILGR